MSGNARRRYLVVVDPGDLDERDPLIWVSATDLLPGHGVRGLGPGGDVVVALDVSGPSHRVRTGARLDHLTAEGAAELSRRLGFRGKRPET